MTVEQFNEKYKDYIEEGFYGLSIDNQNVIKFLDSIFTDLTKIPDFQFAQIKTKFGYARVYTNLSNVTEGLIENKINTYIKHEVK